MEGVILKPEHFLIMQTCWRSKHDFSRVAFETGMSEDLIYLAEAPLLYGYYPEQEVRKLFARGLSAPHLSHEEFMRRARILARAAHAYDREFFGGYLAMIKKHQAPPLSRGAHLAQCCETLLDLIEHNRAIRAAGGHQRACRSLYEAFCDPEAPEIPVSVFEYAERGREVYL